MFTGLVADLGTVAALERGDDGARLRIRTALAGELAEGDSIAVNGACLTAAGVDDGEFAADVMNQTLSLTSLGPLGEGDAVNLELALRASDRLGGHVVQGHVDGTGTVASVREDGFARRVEVELPEELRRYVVERGSVAVDGVSLTVSGVTGDRLRGLADPRDARAHQPRLGRTGARRQHRGRRRRPLRRAPTV